MTKIEYIFESADLPELKSYLKSHLDDIDMDAQLRLPSLLSNPDLITSFDYPEGQNTVIVKLIVNAWNELPELYTHTESPYELISSNHDIYLNITNSYLQDFLKEYGLPDDLKIKLTTIASDKDPNMIINNITESLHLTKLTQLKFIKVDDSLIQIS